MNTLRARLVLGVVVSAVAVFLVAGTTLYTLVERSLVAEVDRELLDKAKLLASTIDQDGPYLDVEFDELSMGDFQSPAGGRFLQLSEAGGGRIFYRSPSLGEQTFVSSASATSSVEGGEPALLGHHWADLPRRVRGRSVALRFTPRQEGVVPYPPYVLELVLARDVADVTTTLATLRGTLFAVGLVAIAVVTGVLSFVVRRSLRSLESLSARIEKIGADSLGMRLETGGVPGELAPVVERLNELFQRLDVAFARERSFAQDVAHELRTPLAGLRNVLEVTGQKRRSTAEYAAALERGTRLVAQLQGVLERLLQLARLETGRPLPSAQPYDLGEFVLECWEPFERAAASRGLRVDLRLEPGLGATADLELMKLLLRNLFENAVAYVDVCGEVALRVQSESSGNGRPATVLEVANTGSRLSQRETLEATRRFWRGDRARSDAGAHCGLGLALVQRAASALGGTLELYSEVGGQFRARVLLPRLDVRVAAREPAPPQGNVA